MLLADNILGSQFKLMPSELTAEKIHSSNCDMNKFSLNSY